MDGLTSLHLRCPKQQFFECTFRQLNIICLETHPNFNLGPKKRNHMLFLSHRHGCVLNIKIFQDCQKQNPNCSVSNTTQQNSSQHDFQPGKKNIGLTLIFFTRTNIYIFSIFIHLFFLIKGSSSQLWLIVYCLLTTYSPVLELSKGVHTVDASLSF